ncbi:hypothetical protein AHF37_02304 [Paragonimus kellicotti]|nr:hypothetical protein AHF37_02304 [Paragonimus kellicotti]
MLFNLVDHDIADSKRVVIKEPNQYRIRGTVRLNGATKCHVPSLAESTMLSHSPPNQQHTSVTPMVNTCPNSPVYWARAGTRILPTIPMSQPLASQHLTAF